MTTLSLKLAPAIVLFAGSAALADNFTIADVAPKGSAFIVSIDDYKAMRASFDKTGFMEVWKDPSMQTWFKKYSKEAIEEFNKDLEEVNLKLEDIKEPSGTVGAAFWITPAANPGEKPAAHTLAFGDWGDNTDEAATKIAESLAQAEEKGKIILDEDEYASTKIFAITDPNAGKPKEEAKADKDEADEDAEDMDFDMPEPEAPFAEMKTVYYARVANNLVFSSDMDSVERVIDRAAGKDADSIGDSADYSAVLAQIGKNQAYAAFFTSSLLDLLAKNDATDRANLSDEEKAMLPPSTSQILGLLGLAGVKGGSFGINFDTDAGMAQGSFGVLVPEKKGLFTLIDPPAAAFSAPAFVSADASTLTMLQFEFAGLFPLLNELSNQLPAEQAAQIQQGLQQASGMAAPILDNIGPQIFVTQSLEKPFSPESQKFLVAIAARNPDAIAQQINTLGGMAGLQARDFQGNQIWSMGEGGPAIPGVGNIALGLGAGHLFIGTGPAVENALRLAANPGDSQLSKDPRFVTALKTLPANGLAFAWADTRQAIEYYDWTLRNMDKIQAKQAEEIFGDDPESQEAKKEYLEAMKQNIPEAVRDLPSLDIIAKHIGDSVGDVQVTPDGLRGKFIYLRPTK